VRQVGHLPEIFEDARSEKYKKSVTRVVSATGVVPNTMYMSS